MTRMRRNGWCGSAPIWRGLSLGLLLTLGLAAPGGAAVYHDGRFDLLVAIDTSEPDNAGLVDRIRTEMEAASHYLWTATREQHRFGKVTILVPRSWTRRAEYLPAGPETFDGSDIRVGSNYKWLAYASGNRIYVHAVDGLTGDGRGIVHEFGHAIYGLGDEYCLYVTRDGKTYLSFRDANGNWRKCTERVTFTTSPDEITAMQRYDVTAASSPPGNSASIMWDQWIDEIAGFCDASEHTSLHNTEQDRQHGNKSCWETLSGRFGLKSEGGTRISYAAVEFEIKQAVDAANIFLVLDRSGSMDGTKISDAKTAAKQFVDLTMDDNVGIASYNQYARVDAHLGPVDSESRRLAVKQAIDRLSAGGNTSIGAGLQAAANDFASSSATGGVEAIVLLTDGLENESPWISNVLPDLLLRKTVVFTVGLGGDVDGNLLTDLAHQTGGEYFFSAGPGQLAEIYRAIKSRIAQSQSVESATLSLYTGAVDEKVVTIDRSIESVAFTITAEDASYLSMFLHDPQGTFIDPVRAQDDPLIEFVRERSYVLYRVITPLPGEWSVTVSNISGPPQSVELSVSGKTPIRLSARTDLASYNYPQPIRITAAAEASQPIIGATVSAIVTRPDASAITLSMNDIGTNGDERAYDGIYTACFGQFNGDGLYGVRVTAVNDAEIAQEGCGFPDLPPATGQTGYRAPSFSGPSLDRFSREVSLPFVNVGQFTAEDLVPPGRITSLHEEVAAQNQIRLGWVAPGGDLYTGTVAAYDVRYSREFITESSWQGATSAPATPTPVPAGVDQTVELAGLPRDTLYFAVRAVDGAGNVSELSNVVEVIPHGAPEPFEQSLYCFPNPFSPERDRVTTVRFVLPASSTIEITVYDVSNTLVWKDTRAGQSGENLVEWNGRNGAGRTAANGVYFLKVSATALGRTAYYKIGVVQ